MNVEPFQIALIAFMTCGIATGFTLNLMVRQVNKAHVAPRIRLFWTMDRDIGKSVFIFKQHQKLFPSSNVRTAFWTLACMSIVLFIVFVFESETTRTESNAVQWSTSEMRTS